jgi:pilus assembly protein TadC
MHLFIAANTTLLLWWLWTVFSARSIRVRELGRFRETEPSVLKDAYAQIDQLALSFDVGAVEDLPRRAGLSAADKELAHSLARAGLESALARGRYVLARNLCWLVFPISGLAGYFWLPAYYATLWTLMIGSAGILMPLLWLRAKTRDRVEEIHRELPLLLDLTNLGTSAGWDVVASLEKVIDGLYAEFPDHPLVREMKKGRWLTASGYTWNEALEKISERIGDETVTRTMTALGQAITQGGSRSRQLESIALDTQRGYYHRIEHRLASLPLKVVLVSVVLMISYFVILLAPALVQMSAVFPG